MKNIDGDLITILCIVAGIGSLYFIVSGYKNRVVIYYDGKDMLVSFLAVLLTASSFWIIKSSPFKSELFSAIWKFGFGPLCGLLGILFLIANFNESIRYNKSVSLGFVIGFFKILFLSVTVLVIFSSFFSYIDPKTRNRNAALLLIFSVFLASLSKALINGPDVYELNGWDPPEDA